MLKIVIIDDEINVRSVIKKLLTLINYEHEIVGEAPSVAEGKKVIIATKPDIVLLDIELEDGTGFHLIDQLPEIDFKLIFITAYNQHAIKAFKFNALDYLLKPIEPAELKEALSKARLSIYSEKEQNELIANLKQNNNSEIKRIVIKTTNNIDFIDVKKILYCHSEGSYTHVITENTKILASRNLKHFQELLPDQYFLRPHQSYLVNRTFITAIKNDALILNGKISIPISSRKKTEIKGLLLDE
ncbi:response regulator transcription factor [Aureibaculum sp. A20]|uniref:Response regulator transcription factor n=1 Tax=Aureibaculum flavum TaxID=2795986 RepID=A0ABS0WUP8_9FLAO|nr:LytTR family DNA-binding domain-containing protein [Aureibaculum flavum]MBJ2175704.1 response regulator transcription factor [Aureibaculum flavum]